MPVKTGAAITAVSCVAIGTQMTILLRKQIDFRLLAVPLSFALLTIALGMRLLLMFPDRTLRVALAVLILSVTVFFFITQKYKIELKKSAFNGAVAGLLTGLSTGTYNIVGPFLSVYYFHTAPSTLAYKASLEFSYLVASLVSTGFHIYHGNFNQRVLPLILASCLGALAAGSLGLKVFKKIDRAGIAKIVYFILPLLALILLLKN